MITVYGLRWAPDFARGLVRDLRVRWALEEAGLDYQDWLVDLRTEQDTPGFRACQPFGQVPVYYEDGGLVMFESGAIVLRIAERSPALLPADPVARARATCWLFSALNTIEPPVQQLFDIDQSEDDWDRARRPQVEALVRRRLDELAAWLGGRGYLEGEFTVGDLMMATVLRILHQTDLVYGHPTLGPYLARCEGRPAFERALTDQLCGYDDRE